MIYFLITWALLAIVSCVAGTYLLDLLKASCFFRIGDRLIIAMWSGLIVIPILLLAVSFIFPLSLLTWVVIAAILIGISLFSSSTSAELIRLKSALPSGWLIAFLCLSLLTATLINRPMEWFDTGGYHIGAIKWLSEAGTVPGVALINYAFGFTSSWFAFAAPLIPGFLGNRIGAVANGFVFLLATFHILVALTHIKQRNCRLADWFVIGVFLIIIATYIGTIVAGSPILISFSPDVPVTLVTGAIAWIILVIKESEKDKNASLFHLAPSAVDVKTLPLVLGVGALSLKLSTLPVLAIVILFYCFENQFALKKLLIGATLVILLALPMLGYGFITSGCPMFPSTIACVNVPWRVPAEEAAKQLQNSRVLQSKKPEGSRVGSEEASSAKSLSSFLRKRLDWIRTQRKAQVMFLLYAASIALSTQQLLFSQSYKSRRELMWVNGLGIVGMTFIIFYAPLIRFGLIYFVLVPGLFLAQFVDDRYKDLHALLQQRFPYRLNQSFNRALLFGLICCFLIIFSENQNRLFFLLPPELPKPELIESRINDVAYTYPAGWSYKCWAAPLPCSGIVLDNIRLRKPSQGIRAGFIRVP